MNVSLMEACSSDLWEDLGVLCERYPKGIVDGILRVRELHQMLVRNPSLKDQQLVREHVERHRVSRPTAYGDLSVVKVLLPTLGREQREFHRWRSKEMLLETYRLALVMKDVRTMERVASTYARVFRVDEEEEQKLPVDRIVPPAFVPTDDPSVLGLKRLENREERIRELLEELGAKNPEIVDVEFESVDIAPSPPGC